MAGANFTNSEANRFLFLVDSVAMDRVEGKAVVTGNIHGSITTKDQVYILHPGRKVSIGAVELIRDENGDMVYNINEGKATITVSLMGARVEVQKFAVLTTIKPQPVVDMNVPVENPYLLALSYEYETFCSDLTYSNILVYELCHSHFVVPFQIAEGAELKEDGRVDIGDDKNVKYLSIHKPGAPEEKIYPVFSDLRALSKWPNVFKAGEKPKVIILPFPKAYAIAKSGHIGMGLNLYGPKPVMFPIELLDSITKLEGYQREFGENVAKRMEGQKLEEGKLIVGIPPQTQEVKLMRDELVTIARTNPDIKRVDLLVKMDAKKEKSYLVVVDCPREKSTEIFDIMDQALVQYASELKLIDYIAMADAGFIANVLNQSNPVYVVRNN